MPSIVHDSLPYAAVVLIAIACYLLAQVVSLLQALSWSASRQSEQVADIREALRVLERLAHSTNADLHALVTHTVPPLTDRLGQSNEHQSTISPPPDNRSAFAKLRAELRSRRGGAG